MCVIEDGFQINRKVNKKLLLQGSGVTQQEGPRSVYNNPELEMMAREIQELMKEKMVLEREVQEVQYNIQARGTESHSLQVS